MIDKVLSFFSLKHGLYQLLKTQPEVKVSLDSLNNLNIESIFPFHLMGIDKNNIDSQPFLPSNISKFCMTTDEVCQIADHFNPIFTCNTYPNYAIEISEIQAFYASKSDLDEYSDVDTFAEETMNKYIQSITEDALAKMLNHEQISIVNSPELTSDSFAIYGWSDKLGIYNNGGSHHLAAAQYIAKRLNQYVSLEAKTTHYSLNEIALSAFNKKYTAFVLPSVAFESNIEKALSDSSLKFTRMNFHPRNHINFQIYFFENTPENSRIISLFHERYTSLNEVLKDRIKFQNQNRTHQNFVAFLNCKNTVRYANNS